MAISFSVNGKPRKLDVEPDMPLLWVLRDELGLTGAKFACGAGLCGACTVHLNGQAVRSCVLPVEAAKGGKITTIEDESAKPVARVRKAWIEAQVPQCGYCQPGMVMAVAAILSEAPQLQPAEVRERLTNVCRCGTYDRIDSAIATLFPVR